MRNTWQLGVIVLAAQMGFAQPTPPAAPRARSAGVTVQNASYLGVGLMDVDSAHAKALKLKEERGAAVTEVDPASPAGKAGLRVGDVILEYNGQAVQNTSQLQSFVRGTNPGHEAKLSVWRNGAAQAITATIESRRMVMIAGDPSWYAAPTPIPPEPPDRPITAMSSTWPPFPANMDFDMMHMQTVMQNSILGIAGEPLGDEQQFAEFFGVKDGVLVKAVDSNSAAERAGIKVGDVIVKVGDTRVGSLRELTVALRTARSKGSYTVTVVRNKKEMPVTVGG
jgi:serine protease Do